MIKYDEYKAEKEFGVVEIEFGRLNTEELRESSKMLWKCLESRNKQFGTNLG